MIPEKNTPPAGTAPKPVAYAINRLYPLIFYYFKGKKRKDRIPFVSVKRLSQQEIDRLSSKLCEDSDETSSIDSPPIKRFKASSKMIVSSDEDSDDGDNTLFKKNSPQKIHPSKRIGPLSKTRIIRENSTEISANESVTNYDKEESGETIIQVSSFKDLTFESSKEGATPGPNSTDWLDHSLNMTKKEEKKFQHECLSGQLAGKNDPTSTRTIGTMTEDVTNAPLFNVKLSDVMKPSEIGSSKSLRSLRDMIKRLKNHKNSVEKELEDSINQMKKKLEDSINKMRTSYSDKLQEIDCAIDDQENLYLEVLSCETDDLKAKPHSIYEPHLIKQDPDDGSSRQDSKKSTEDSKGANDDTGDKENNNHNKNSTRKDDGDRKRKDDEKSNNENCKIDESKKENMKSKNNDKKVDERRSSRDEERKNKEEKKKITERNMKEDEQKLKSSEEKKKAPNIADEGQSTQGIDVSSSQKRSHPEKPKDSQPSNPSCSSLASTNSGNDLIHSPVLDKLTNLSTHTPSNCSSTISTTPRKSFSTSTTMSSNDKPPNPSIQAAVEQMDKLETSMNVPPISSSVVHSHGSHLSPAGVTPLVPLSSTHKVPSQPAKLGSKPNLAAMTTTACTISRGDIEATNLVASQPAPQTLRQVRLNSKVHPPSNLPLNSLSSLQARAVEPMQRAAFPRQFPQNVPFRHTAQRNRFPHPRSTPLYSHGNPPSQAPHSVGAPVLTQSSCLPPAGATPRLPFSSALKVQPQPSPGSSKPAPANTSNTFSGNTAVLDMPTIDPSWAPQVPATQVPQSSPVGVGTPVPQSSPVGVGTQVPQSSPVGVGTSGNQQTIQQSEPKKKFLNVISAASISQFGVASSQPSLAPSDSSSAIETDSSSDGALSHLPPGNILQAEDFKTAPSYLANLLNRPNLVISNKLSSQAQGHGHLPIGPSAPFRFPKAPPAYQKISPSITPMVTISKESVRQLAPSSQLHHANNNIIRVPGLMHHRPTNAIPGPLMQGNSSNVHFTKQSQSQHSSVPYFAGAPQDPASSLQLFPTQSQASPPPYSIQGTTPGPFGQQVAAVQQAHPMNMGQPRQHTQTMQLGRTLPQGQIMLQRQSVRRAQETDAVPMPGQIPGTIFSVATNSSKASISAQGQLIASSPEYSSMNPEGQFPGTTSIPTSSSIMTGVSAKPSLPEVDTCFLCGRTATITCCGNFVYCSDGCKAADFGRHQQECKAK